MKKISLVLIALFFQPFAVQAETPLDQTESFQIARAVKMGRKTSTSSPFHNNDIMKGNGGGEAKPQIKCPSGQHYSPSAGGCIVCSTGQYYSPSADACVGICTGVTCGWSDVYEPKPNGNKCCCVDK